MNIKDYVKDCDVEYIYYIDGNLWYEVIGGPTKFEFPVPTSDVGNATFRRKEKAILLMRYIRKHMETLKEGSNA